jgi:hypothetical protein
MISTITDTCPYDCRLPVNLPNEFSGKRVKITIEVVEPEPMGEVPTEPDEVVTDSEEVSVIDSKKVAGKKQ